MLPEPILSNWQTPVVIMTLENIFSCKIIVNIWNSLPSEVVNTPTLNSLKNSLDIFWMNQDILYKL